MIINVNLHGPVNINIFDGNRQYAGVRDVCRIIILYTAVSSNVTAAFALIEISEVPHYVLLYDVPVFLSFLPSFFCPFCRHFK